jgi:predicted RNase H-like nuclease (RuvC/YqgF family)
LKKWRKRQKNFGKKRNNLLYENSKISTLSGAIQILLDSSRKAANLIKKEKKMGSKVLLLIMLILGLIGCATTRQEMSKDELQTRVRQLEAQLQEKDEKISDLEEQLALSQKPSEVKIYSVSPKTEEDFISKPLATEIQTALKNAGFYNGSIDGKIGKRTKQAIRDFQKANGLVADGIVGNKTWAKLGKYLY